MDELGSHRSHARRDRMAKVRIRGHRVSVVHDSSGRSAPAHTIDQMSLLIIPYLEREDILQAHPLRRLTCVEDREISISTTA